MSIKQQPMKRKGRILFLAFTLILIITGCKNGKSKSEFTVKKLPYTISDETIKADQINNIKTPEDEYKTEQILKSISVRDLTPEENKRFVERMKNLDDKNLNNKYSIIEFDFGDMTHIYKTNTFYFFDEMYTAILVDDKEVATDPIQISINDDKQSMIGKNEKNDEDTIFGVKLNGYKILMLIDKSFLTDNTLLKTVINNETVYFNINNK